VSDLKGKSALVTATTSKRRRGWLGTGLMRWSEWAYFLLDVFAVSASAFLERVPHRFRSHYIDIHQPILLLHTYSTPAVPD
jgi:hypothetical protein